MKTITLEVELYYDDELHHSGDNDEEAKEWFFNEILFANDDSLFLHSNEIGDTIGTITVKRIVTEQ